MNKLKSCKHDLSAVNKRTNRNSPGELLIDMCTWYIELVGIALLIEYWEKKGAIKVQILDEHPNMAVVGEC